MSPQTNIFRKRNTQADLGDICLGYHLRLAHDHDPGCPSTKTQAPCVQPFSLVSTALANYLLPLAFCRVPRVSLFCHFPHGILAITFIQMGETFNNSIIYEDEMADLCIIFYFFLQISVTSKSFSNRKFKKGNHDIMY